jgi:cyanophycin synthetase
VLTGALALGGADLPPDSVLAAVAAAWALRIPAELICAGLRTFGAEAQRVKH